MWDQSQVFVNQIVSEIIELAQSNEHALVSFKNRLALSRYDAADDRAEQPYQIYRLESYRVDDISFPRIRRSAVSTAIVEGEYQLSIPALQQWNTETD